MAIFFSIFFLVAVWGTYLLLQYGGAQGLPQMPVLFPSFATALVVGGFGGFSILKKLKAKAAAKALDKTLDEQADAQEQGSDPSQQPQIREMRAEFEKAVGSLKSSRLGRSGRDALSALPWYVIIGPPGTGKSTALRSSGLKFPYLTKKGGVRGVGGTRNCDWWLTNEGVLLDTAGRYMTEDDDQDEWLSFLDAVAKARPRRPINGLLVTVAAPDLLAADEQGAAELGQQLRERVDEVTGRLHLVVPVYLLVTKCDLLAGFVETFGNLAKSERGQIWGLTVPVGTSHPDGPGQLVREKVDELTAVLEERAVGRMAQERRMESRERIFRFPRQLAALRANLGEVVQALFSENPYQDTPLLRGVYFTSGTQEGRPIDKVMAAMAQAFGIRSALPAAAEPATDSRSYFLTGLFNEIIFKDQKLAVRSSAALQRQKRTRYAYAGAAAALSVALVILPLLAFGSMRAQSAALAQAVKEVSGISYPADRLARLDALRQQLQEMRDQESSAVGGLWTFGMNRRAQLLDAALPVYGHWVRELIVMEVAARDEKELAKLPDPEEAAPLAPLAPQPQPGRRHRRRDSAPIAPTSSSAPSAASEAPDLDATFERLKRHMLLSLQPGDRPLTDEKLFKRELQSLVARLADDYKSQSSVTTEPELIRRQLAFLFELWPDYRDAWKLERRDELRRKGQAALADMDRARRLLEQGMREWSGDDPDLTLASMVGDLNVYETSQVVRAAFTKAVWEKRVRATLENPPPDDDAWILGMRPADAQLKESLRREYYLQYIREWTHFLGSVRLRAVKDPNDVARRLEKLTDSESPLKALFKALSDNVLLATPRLGEQPAAPDERTVTLRFLPLAQADTGWAPKVAAKLGFKLPSPPMALEVYEGRLKEFLKAVEGAKDANARADVAKSLRSEASNMTSVIVTASQGDVYQEVLKQLWVEPLLEMANALDLETRQKLNWDWCEAVYSLHRTDLRGHFPFSRTGTEASLGAFIELYGGNGKVFQFYKGKLDSKVVNDGREFHAANGAMVLDALLEYLKRAKTLLDALFPNNSPEPQLELAVVLRPPNARNIVGVSFSLDGQQVYQDTGPRSPHPARWPGADPKAEKGAYLTIVRKGGAPVKIDCRDCYGTWGFFQLLSQGHLEKRGTRSFTMSWDKEVDGQNVTVEAEFTWTRSVSPFFGREGSGNGAFLSVFKDVEPPAAIVPGVEPCR